MSNLTNDWSAYVFDIGIAYKEDTDKVVGILQQVLRDMQQDKKIGSLIVEEPEVFGVDKFDTSAVVIKGRIKTKPIRQWEVGREFLRRVKQAFDKHGIEIPFPHQTLYVGEKSKPFEVQVIESLQNKEKA
jgi:small conductance mechanosensitive channel